MKSELAPLAPACEDLSFPKNRAFLILGGAAVISAGLSTALTLEGYAAVHITPGKKTAWKSEHEIGVNFSSESAIKKLGILICKKYQPGALINLFSFTEPDDKQIASEPIEMLFMVLKTFINELKTSIDEGAGWLINFTCMGGQFGIGQQKEFDPLQAGSIGIAKTVSREWPNSRVKCIDIDDDLDPHMLLPLILDELATSDSAIEVGFTSRGRQILALETEKQPTHADEIHLNSESVILLTGGAYGITAEFAKQLAERHQARLILIGRSPLPEKESAITAGFTDQSELRTYFINESRKEDIKTTPATIEKKVKKIFKNREILGNLQSMRDAGSQVEYFSVDVSDANAFQEIINDTYTRLKRIDGVIHGAGIIEDQLIQNKTLDSFKRVFTTKTVPAEILLKSLQPETLKLVMFFSSVAARYGNVGQADYSAANEVLNKTAHCLKIHAPQSRIISINWGPWDSGMVTKSLSELYTDKGIGLIPVSQGVRLGFNELADKGADIEVLIAADVNKISQWGLGET